MNPEQWARVKHLFDAALAHDAGARRAFVAEASSGDEAVRAEVERLLDADLASAGFLESPAADALLSGRVIGHYEIGRMLGTGGMGRVYAARDVELGREVALKVASFETDDSQVRLRREAQHASRMNHPHICHIYEVGRADGQLFVVMELVEGRPLADLVREGPLSIANVRRYGSEIADALAHAHEHGVTHHDLKSTNVMITPKRGSKVLDFGLARRLDTHQIDALSHSQRSLTAAGMIAGTLPYMAPELLRGQRGDQRADIWALGVLLHEMVTGRRPFTGGTGFELSAAILSQPPDALPPDVPASLRGIIQRCLAKDPADRYQHASDVHLALDGMTSDTAISPKRIPAVPMRWVAGLLLLVATIAIAGVVYGLRSPEFSNMRGYALLESGAVEEAIAQFRGVTNREPDDANAWDSLGEGFLANGMPERSLEWYSRALAINSTFQPSLLGRGLALAALGRYDEALGTPLPDFRVQAFLLSRIGRYREAAAVLADGRREATADDDDEAAASASLTSSWLLIEQQQYARALDELRTVEEALATPGDTTSHPMLVLADLLGGVAEIRSGNVQNAVARLTSQKSRHDSDDRLEANWVAALEGEIALAQGQHDLAATRFTAAGAEVWPTLARDLFAVFGINPPSRDGMARVEVARGNRDAAIEEYRRLTAAGPGQQASPVLEPRHVLALARLLEQDGNAAGARAEYERFLTLWANADQGLPETEEARRAVGRLPAS